MKKTIITAILIIILTALSILRVLGYELIPNVIFFLILISIYIINFSDLKENLKRTFLIMLTPIIVGIALLLVLFFTTNNSLIMFFTACFFVSLFGAVIYAFIKR